MNIRRNAQKKIGFGVAVMMASAGLVTSTSTVPAGADVAIVSDGPLTPITISSTLGCAIPDEFGEHFVAGDRCGTLVYVDEGPGLYGPLSLAESTALTPFEPVEEFPPTGEGTSLDPLTVAHDVNLSGAEPVVRQVDTYVPGENTYRTDVTVSNPGSLPVTGTLYRFAHCQFTSDGGSETGYAIVEVDNVACLSDLSAGSVSKEYRPLTDGYSFQAATADVLAGVMEAGNGFDGSETVSPFDVAIGISWPYRLEPGEAATYSHLSTFDRIDRSPVLSSVTPSVSQTGFNTVVGYTVDFRNPNSDTPVPVSEVVMSPPLGFSYVPGSTSGFVGGDPAVFDGLITWPGGGDIAAGGTESFRFSLTTGNQPGTFTIDVGGTSPGFAFSRSEQAAPVDVVPTVTIADGSVTEGDSGTAALSFEVTLDGAGLDDITLVVSTTDGTTTAGTDYLALSAEEVMIPAGDTTGRVEVLVTGDVDAEADETFTLAVDSLTGAEYSPATVTGTIVDDDAAAGDLPTVSVADSFGVAEDGGGDLPILSFEVTLSQPASSAVEVFYSVAGGTAAAGTDFDDSDGSVLIEAGSTSAFAQVDVLDDSLHEADETVLITLTSADGATLGAPDTAAGTIFDDDPEPSVTVGDATTSEGSTRRPGTAEVPISLDAPSGLDVRVWLASVEGTASDGSDYLGFGEYLVTIPAGETMASIPITLVGDGTDEPTETFSVSAYSVDGALAGDLVGLVTILDDDPPKLRVLNTTVTEASGVVTAQVPVTLSSASPGPVTIDFVSESVTAYAGDDFDGTPGSVVIPAGDLAAVIEVAVLPDTIDEPIERFLVRIDGVTGYANPVDPTGTVYIEDDDLPPVVSVESARVIEGDPGCDCFIGLAFTVRLTERSEFPVEVLFRTAGITATPNVDFGSRSAVPVRIHPGNTTGIAFVPVHSDNHHEFNERLRVTLYSPVNATLAADPTAIGTIIDDEGPFYVRVADEWRTEDSGLHQVQLTLNADPLPGETVTVALATAHGTARGTDYTPVATTVRFDGSTGRSVWVPVTVRADTRIEDDEHFYARLSSPSRNLSISDAEGVVTVVDDD